MATRGLAASQPPSAAGMAQAVDPARDANELFISAADGTRVSLGDASGQLLVVNLWGPWCQPCRREMPSLSRLADQVDPTRIKVLPLAFDWRGPVWVQKFFDEVAITNLPVLMGDGQNLFQVLGLKDLPSTAILNQSGHHIFTVAGEAVWDDFETLEWLNGLAR